MISTPSIERNPDVWGGLNQDVVETFAEFAEAARTIVIPNHPTARFEPFEGYRSPRRQEHLFSVTKTTKARPWQSAHQYGLAVDFAIEIVNPSKSSTAPDFLWKWYSDAPWGKLKILALRYGLDIPIKNDLGHVEHPWFKDVRAAWR